MNTDRDALDTRVEDLTRDITPGPWRLAATGLQHPNRPTYDDSIVGADGEVIISAQDEQGGESWGRETDAQFIAAAPALVSDLAKSRNDLREQLNELRRAIIGALDIEPPSDDEGLVEAVKALESLVHEQTLEITELRDTVQQLLNGSELAREREARQALTADVLRKNVEIADLRRGLESLKSEKNAPTNAPQVTKVIGPDETEGYSIIRSDEGFRWVYGSTREGIEDSSNEVFALESAALRDAAEDWDTNGSKGRVSATLRGMATRLEGKGL